MMIDYEKSPRYARALDSMGQRIDYLCDNILEASVIREELNCLISTALQLRAGIEYEQKCRGEHD